MLSNILAVAVVGAFFGALFTVHGGNVLQGILIGAGVGAVLGLLFSLGGKKHSHG